MIEETSRDEESSPDKFERMSGAAIRALMHPIVRPGLFVGLLVLVVFALRLTSPRLDLDQRAARTKIEVPESITAVPAPRESARNNTVVASRSFPSKPPHIAVPRASEPINVPDVIRADTVIHTVRRGESVPFIARQYLAQTVFLTAAELEMAIRQANTGKPRKSPSPGDEVIIPGYQTTPVVERPVPMAKDNEVRAIYLTGLMAGSKRGVNLIRRWKELGGNAIVFDIKDSDGSVSVAFNHELAPKQHYPCIHSLPKFARFLHSLGLHAIARIAVFRDERLVRRRPQFAVQSRRSNQPWRENRKLVWADPSHPEVQDYNIALAKQAASSGVDEIQFDYIRFPAEGNQRDTRFFFQGEHPEWPRSKVISDFLSRAYAELHPLGVLVSLDVFGVMAWQRPVDLAHTGQDIAAIARFCDVLSPMIYPSHFFRMGYARPGDAPEHFIGASMERLLEITADTNVIVRPWLQAFAWRTRTYSPRYILRQVSMAKENGGIGFLLWNARNDYSKPFLAMPQMHTLPAAVLIRGSISEQPK